MIIEFNLKGTVNFMFKRKFTLFAIAVSILLLAGCGSTENVSSSDLSSSSDESSSAINLTEIMPELMERELEIENIYNGIGLDGDLSKSNPPDENGHQFVPVKSDKYKTILDIKNATESVFTENYAESELYEYAFEAEYRRYKEENNQLFVDMGIGGAVNCKWEPSTMKILEENGTTYVIEMNYINYDQVRTAKITLVKNGDTVLIDKLEK